MTNAIANTPAPNPFAALERGGSPAAAADDSKASADRFLTMLVTQLQNQDPLNPMDNAQITSQMAQINAVTGLDKVNQSVRALNGALLQMQALQGAALVGREVMLPGNRLAVADGQARGGIEIGGSADSVRVEVLDGAQRVVGAVELGAKEAGRHDFAWPVGRLPAGADYAFRVTASLAGQPVETRTLSLDRVQSVSTAGDALTLGLARSGPVPLSDIASFR